MFLLLLGHRRIQEFRLVSLWEFVSSSRRTLIPCVVPSRPLGYIGGRRM